MPVQRIRLEMPLLYRVDGSAREHERPLQEFRILYCAIPSNEHLQNYAAALAAGFGSGWILGIGTLSRCQLFAHCTLRQLYWLDR